MPIDPEPTHYDNLMVSRHASLEVIRAAYRALTQKYHPDRNPGDDEATRLMQVINDSYAVLGDPEKRQEYDRCLAEEERTLALALQAPVLQEAVEGAHGGMPAVQKAPAQPPRRRRLATFAIPAAVLLAGGAVGAHYYAPEALLHRLPFLAGRFGAAPEPVVAPGAAPAIRHQWQSGSIERPSSASSDAVSSSSSASSAASSDSAASSSDGHASSSASSAASLSASPEPSQPSPQPAAPPAQTASKPHPARPPKHAGSPVRLVAAARAHSGPAAAPAHPAMAPAPPPAPPAAPAPPDELAEVRSRDPNAAERIASYCISVAKSTMDGGAACRRNEILAWRHFTIGSNFATLYEEVRSHCAPSVYPDSYEAREACVKYELGSRTRNH